MGIIPKFILSSSLKIYKHTGQSQADIFSSSGHLTSDSFSSIVVLLLSDDFLLAFTSSPAGMSVLKSKIMIHGDITSQLTLCVVIPHQNNFVKMNSSQLSSSSVLLIIVSESNVKQIFHFFAPYPDLTNANEIWDELSTTKRNCLF